MRVAGQGGGAENIRGVLEHAGQRENQGVAVGPQHNHRQEEVAVGAEIEIEVGEGAGVVLEPGRGTAGPQEIVILLSRIFIPI